MTPNTSNKKLLTIVITNYNTPQKILLKCIASVYPLINEIDLLLIDDCSEELYWTELNEIFKLDFPALKIIRNKTNLGRGPNNFWAVFKATTKFVRRLDSDDFIHLEELQKFLVVLAQNPDKKIIFNSFYFNDTRKIRVHQYFTHLNRMFNGNVTYNLPFLKSLQLNETQPGFLEDKIFILHVLKALNSRDEILYSPLAYYSYIVRGSSSLVHIYDQQSEYLEAFFVFYNLVTLTKSKYINKIIHNQIDWVIIFALIVFTIKEKDKKFATSYKTKIIAFEEHLKQNPNYYNQKFNNFTKLIYLLLKKCPFLLYIIQKIIF